MTKQVREKGYLYMYNEKDHSLVGGVPSRAWKAFLPIPTLLHADQAPEVDVTRLLAAGIEPEGGGPI